MRKKTILTCFIILSFSQCISYCFGQEEAKVVKGNVISYSTEHSVPYTNITIHEEGKVKEAYANADGYFDIMVTKGAKLIFSAVGFQKDSFIYDGISTQLTISLHTLSKQIDEISVVGKLPVKQEVDRLIYEVHLDADVAGVSAAQFLNKVPLLHIGDNKLRISGRSSVLVLLNGKRNVVAELNPVLYLESIPADRIHNVEVISFIPEQYQNQGFDSAINIVLKKEGRTGYEGSLTTSISLPGNYKGTGLMDWKYKKASFTVFANYSHNDSPIIYRLLDREGLADGASILSQKTSINRVMKTIKLGGTASYSFSDEQALTIDVYGQKLRGREYKDMRTFNFIERDTLGYMQFNKEEFPESSIDMRLNYQLFFKSDKKRKIELFYRFIKNNYEQDNIASIASDGSDIVKTIEQSNMMRFLRHAVQLDYAHPTIIPNLNFNSGIKAHVDLNRNLALYSIDGQNLGLDSTENRQTNFVWYGAIGFRKEKWTAKGALSLEHTRISTTYIDDNNLLTVQRNNYFSWLPTFLLQYKVNTQKSLNFSFEKNVLRPNVLQLNNFVDRQNSFNLQVGNPRLEPTTTYKYGANYQVLKKNSYRISYEYQYTGNAVQLVIRSLANDVLERSFVNTGKIIEHTASFYTNIPLFEKKVNMAITTRGAYQVLQGIVDSNMRTREGWTGGMLSNGSYTFRKDWRMSYFLNLSLPRIGLQQKNNLFHSSSIDVSRNFPKKKLRVTASVTNPFTGTQYLRTVNETLAVRQTNEGRFPYRFYGVSINYRFGKLKTGIKHIDSKIKEDNLMSDQLRN